MATPAKKATKRVAKTAVATAVTNVVNAPAVSEGDIVKNAYITSAHAHVAKLGAGIGDTVYVCNYVGTDNVNDSFGNPLPAGCSINRRTTDTHYAENVILHGIDADGNVVVSRSRPPAKHFALPYTFIRKADRTADAERQRASLKLNDSYTGTVLGDASVIAVGCQRFKTEKLRDLLKLAEAEAAKVKTAATTKTPAANLTTRAATYTAPVATPKAAKKAATKR